MAKDHGCSSSDFLFLTPCRGSGLRGKPRRRGSKHLARACMGWICSKLAVSPASWMLVQEKQHGMRTCTYTHTHLCTQGLHTHTPFHTRSMRTSLHTPHACTCIHFSPYLCTQYTLMHISAYSTCQYRTQTWHIQVPVLDVEFLHLIGQAARVNLKPRVSGLAPASAGKCAGPGTSPQSGL